MTFFDITVYFDIICPWCFIGHRTLDQAIDLYQRTYPDGRYDTFKFTFHPYYLDMSYLGAAASNPGVQMDKAIAVKNGGNQVEAIMSRLHRAGQAQGINFDFDGKTGSSRLSHQLVNLAGEHHGPAMQKRLIESVYSMHFEHGGDITSPSNLTKAAVDVGLTEDAVRKWLQDEDAAAAGAKLDEMAAKARTNDGVTSVPTFVINGVRIEGAEDIGTLYETLVEVKGDASLSERLDKLR